MSLNLGAVSALLSNLGATLNVYRELGEPLGDPHVEASLGEVRAADLAMLKERFGGELTTATFDDGTTVDGWRLGSSAEDALVVRAHAASRLQTQDERRLHHTSVERAADEAVERRLAALLE